MELSFYIPFEEYEIEDVNWYPGNYDWEYEDGPFFEDVLKEVLLHRVGLHVKAMGSLFEVNNVKNISVGADLFGIGDQLARCIRRPAKDGSIYASIQLGPDIIYHYLKAHWEKEHQVPSVYDLTVLHELIHVIDPEVTDGMTLGDAATDPLVNFFGWLQDFRTEGLAELPIFITDPRAQDDPKAISNAFENIFELLAEDFRSLEPLPHMYYDKTKELLHSPYAFGPYFLIGLIEQKGGFNISKGMVSVFGEDPSHYEVVKLGLEINREAYFEHMVDLQFEGKYILDRKLFAELLLNRLEASKNYWESQSKRGSKVVHQHRDLAKRLLLKINGN